MSKATFEDFIKESPSHKSLLNNTDARAIFEILNEDSRIYEAIKASDNERPALEPSINIIEGCIKNQIAKSGSTTFPLDKDFNRQAVGRFQQTILARFGYVSSNSKMLSKSLNAEWFRTASCYRKLTHDELEHETWRGTPWKDIYTMRIVITIKSEEI